MIDVLVNDADAQDETSALWSVGSVAYGGTAIISNQIVSALNAGFFGGDSFEYTVPDTAGGTDTAMVSVTVWVDSTGGINQTFTADINAFGNPG